MTVLGGDIGDVRHRRAVCPQIAYMPQGLGKNLYLELSRLRQRRLHGAAVRAFTGRAQIEGHAVARGHRPRAVPRPSRRQALGRHEAEGRPVRRARPRSRPAHPRRADDRRRSAFAPAVLDADRRDPQGSPEHERRHRDGVHGRSAAVGLDRRDGRRQGARDGDAERAHGANRHEGPRSLLHRAAARRETRGTQAVGRAAAARWQARDRHRRQGPDAPFRQLHGCRSRHLADRARRDLRFPGLERLRQVDDDEDADGLAAADGGQCDAVRPVRRGRQHGGPQKPRLHDAGVLALRRAHRARRT